MFCTTFDVAPTIRKLQFNLLTQSESFELQTIRMLPEKDLNCFHKKIYIVCWDLILIENLSTKGRIQKYKMQHRNEMKNAFETL